MKTIRYKEIDSYTIIERFDELPDDPARTNKIVNSIIEQLPEKKKFNELLQARNSYNEKINVLDSKAKTLYRVKTSAETLKKKAKSDFEINQLSIEIGRAVSLISDFLKNIELHQRRILTLELEIEDINKILDEKRAKITKENIVYCHPRKNEIALTVEEYEQIKAIWKDKANNQQIVIDIKEIDSVLIQKGIDNEEIKGKITKIIGKPRLIDDLRGKQYFWKDPDGKWQKSEPIEKIGIHKKDVVPAENQETAFEFSDLTDDDRETIKIQSLNIDEREKKKKKEIDAILRESAIMKIELDILGKKDALKKSQAFYGEEIKKIEEKYKD